MKKAIRMLGILAAVGTFLVAAPARAVWPFNESDASKADKLASQGNAQLQAADETWRAGNQQKASELYQAAAETYQQAEKLVPNMQNGLIRFRISYCSSQVNQILNASREKAKADQPRVSVTHPPGLARGADTPPPMLPDDPMAAPVASSETVNIPREIAIAQRFILSDHPEDALISLVKVLRADPANRRGLLLMATVRVQQGRYDDAIVTIETLRETEEDEAVLLLASGAYCGAGRYFDALLALDKLMKKSPELPQAHINMAYLLLEMTPEKRADAETYYKHALKLGSARDAMLEKKLGLKP
jgi:tetratricopeptide (TPR) repeat protein